MGWNNEEERLRLGSQGEVGPENQALVTLLMTLGPPAVPGSHVCWWCHG